MRVGSRFFAVILAAGGTAVGCSAGTTDHASPPTSATYQIEFPSTAAAVGADTVQAFVFADPSQTKKTDCTSLIVARQSMGNLPAAEAQTTQVALCEVLSGGMGANIPNVPYGPVSVLVVTQRAGADYFTGCALANLGNGSPPVSVQLQQAVATAHIPGTNCMNVSQICAMPPTCCVGCDGG